MVKQKHKMWYKIRSDTEKAEYHRKFMNLNKYIKKKKSKKFENRTNVKFGIERVLEKINEFEIGKNLKKPKKSKSMGPYQIHPMILKECALEYAKPLTILFRQSMKQEKIPNS